LLFKTVETVKLLSSFLINPRLKSWVTETKKLFLNRFSRRDALANGLSNLPVNLGYFITIVPGFNPTLNLPVSVPFTSKVTTSPF
jgi:hypothetical protein